MPVETQPLEPDRLPAQSLRREARPATVPDAARRSVLASRGTLLVATVLVGLSAGFFFTYEASVTLGLAEVGDLTYVETFQAINETVRNPAFGVVFFGSIPAIAIAAGLNWNTVSSTSRRLLAAALPLYLVGLAITGVGNVALNDELAEVQPLTSSSAAAARADFEDDWNRLNLLRSLSIGASFVSLATAGLLAGAPAGGSE